jgi:hypothetical protein
MGEKTRFQALRRSECTFLGVERLAGRVDAGPVLAGVQAPRPARPVRAATRKPAARRDLVCSYRRPRPYTLTVIGTLALTIGAATAVFAMRAGSGGLHGEGVS